MNNKISKYYRNILLNLVSQQEELHVADKKLCINHIKNATYEELKFLHDLGKVC